MVPKVALSLVVLLAAADPATVAGHLAMHDGGTLEARGSPAALSVVERALAELR